MNRETFIFHTDWHKAMEGLDDSVKLELFQAIVEYATKKNIISLSPIAQIAFNFIKLDIERDLAKYEAATERNRINGAKGGRPVKDKEENPNNPVGFSETQKTEGFSENLEKPKKPDNDNEYDNDSIKKKILSKERMEKENLFPRASEKIDVEIDRMDYKKFVGEYHKICKSFHKVTELTTQRKRQIRTRFMTEMKGDWNLLAKVLSAMENSEFMKQNADTWANFDWLIKNSNNWVKILEGNYNGKRDEHKSGTGKIQAGSWGKEDDDTTL